jgi:acyl carrier protein
MQASTLERIRKLACEVFACEAEDINDETTARDVNGWDSLSHTIFIMIIEKEF